MALVPCRECGREISTEALACPQCGAPKAASHPAAQGETRCRQCHRLVAPDAEVCPTCETPWPAAPAAAPTAPPGVLIVQARKSRGLFIVLGLFLGCLGFHNFYAGYYAKGAIQLVVTLVLGWVIVGLVITAVWALIEIIVVTTDAQGHAMS